MDVESYDVLLLRTKESLDIRCSKNASSIVTHFLSTLEECSSCVLRSLDLATKLLEERCGQVNKLCDYIKDAISVIQMLSDFIKYVIETTSMACCSMKTFPITTGNIILTVFTHCKDSECIYGNNLKSTEAQLKNLFRACHELQLTYLMTMEKHFIFDLTEKHEQDILIEALNIYMKICEIVKVLDVKTMAEQCKAYTAICEKYSNFLLDKNIYNKCTALFASTIKDNIKTAVESEDDKIILRSLKIGNFIIKILLRISKVFKQAPTNDYENVVELLQYIYIHNPAYLELTSEKSQEFLNLMLTNILNPTDILCNTLLRDEKFLEHVIKVDILKLETDNFLGYILLIASLMKGLLQKNENQVQSTSKQELIGCVYRILPMGHYWFNVGLKFKRKKIKDHTECLNLYEYLLEHIVAFACTLNCEQYAELEIYMYEAILSTDCYSALFSSNLWIILASLSSDQLLSDTLSSLINVYQQLEKYKGFHKSPQEVHISFTISKLFEISSSVDKQLISKQFHPQQSVWSILKTSHLPDHLRRNSEPVILENMKKIYHRCFESPAGTEKDITDLIQNMKKAARLSLVDNNTVVIRYVIKLWSKVCNIVEYIKTEDVTSATVWYYYFLEALVSLTECLGCQYIHSAHTGKIMHSMSTILESCNTDLVILLFNLFCSLTFHRNGGENQLTIDAMFRETLNLLLKCAEVICRSYILTTLTKYRRREQFLELTSSILYDESICNDWKLNCDIQYKRSTEWRKQLTRAGYYAFVHKCSRSYSSCVVQSERIKKSVESNFELGDFSFDDDVGNIEEPSRKKIKFDNNETECIIEKLENDTSLLRQVEDALSDGHKSRISNVIIELRNIIS